ncbi:hypothetical protein TNIN_108231 [Trichonephila inaurata madagascariensis]|uniref:Uncharacterized protein n=1 Tax=Trichonephila inaurata madagascariensis TaxID=2747483 RepID=A0A8X6WNT6_9ARAC|nr:hypothetical protein TNIN_108231 [Trichonephila inaurata madagascariensis]
MAPISSSCHSSIVNYINSNLSIVLSLPSLPPPRERYLHYYPTVTVIQSLVVFSKSGLLLQTSSDNYQFERQPFEMELSSIFLNQSSEGDVISNCQFRNNFKKDFLLIGEERMVGY